MKIALLYNRGAGRRISLESVSEMLVREGHELVRVITDEADPAGLCEAPAELVVAAGGDGTVSAAARAVAGSGVPLAVLPFGTANNIAVSLGARAPMARLARHWHEARRLPLDLGVARGACGTRQFMEGIGGGLVAAGIADMQTRPAEPLEAAAWKIARALRRYSDILSRLLPRRWTMTVDGRMRTGEYLLVEVLNSRAVGPNLELGPECGMSDGLLDVVAAGQEHRQALASYLSDRRAGRDARLALPMERARRVEVHGPYEVHVDDALVSDPSDGVLSIEIQPGAVTVLETRF